MTVITQEPPNCNEQILSLPGISQAQRQAITEIFAKANKEQRAKLTEELASICERYEGSYSNFAALASFHEDISEWIVARN